MKKFILSLFISFILFNIQAATYYVSTTGSNSNDGSIDHPYATINYAWSRVANNSTDIIYVRGGTYTYSMIGVTILSGKNGIDANNMITVANYMNEVPVIDFEDYTVNTATQIMRIENCDYVNLRGFELKHNLQLESTDRLGYGLRIAMQVNNCLFERFNIHHCGGWGVIIWGGSNTNGQQSNNNTYYRIDSHHHSDRYSGDPWGGSDGFLINSYNGYLYPSYGTHFVECRGWYNSDDGWDNRLFNGDVTYDRCWAFWNGYAPGETDDDADSWTATGNGYGFKLGSVRNDHDPTALRTMRNCLAFGNAQTGIQAEWSDVSEGGHCFSSNLYNNTAYSNGYAGFSCGAVTGVTTTLRNNISFQNGYDVVSTDVDVDSEYDASDYSGWNGRDFIPTTADFVSLNSTGVDGARGSNGELPVLTFLHLASTSTLINAGTDVGIDYIGAAPDLGAYEYGTEEEPEPEPEDPYSPTSLGRYNKFNGKYLKHNGKYIKW